MRRARRRFRNLKFVELGPHGTFYYRKSVVIEVVLANQKLCARVYAPPAATCTTSRRDDDGHGLVHEKLRKKRDWGHMSTRNVLEPRKAFIIKRWKGSTQQCSKPHKPGEHRAKMKKKEAAAVEVGRGWCRVGWGLFCYCFCVV